MNTTDPILDLFTDKRPTVIEAKGGEFLRLTERQPCGELTITSVRVVALGKYQCVVRYNEQRKEET